jgi:hypothetical protein
VAILLVTQKSSEQKQKFMKKYFGVSFLKSRLGAGVALLALGMFAPLSRASVDINVIDNLHNTPVNSLTENEYGQTFTTTTGGLLDGVALTLANAGDANIYLLTGTYSGAYTLTLLGSISSSQGSGVVGINTLVNTPYLSDNTTYGLVVDMTSSTLAWNYQTGTDPGTGFNPTGTLDERIVFGGGSPGSPFNTVDTNPGDNSFLFGISVLVPEVPMTGLVMGFGVLGMAVSGTLLRKFRPAISRIV